MVIPKLHLLQFDMLRDFPRLMSLQLCQEDTEEIIRVSGGMVSTAADVALQCLGHPGARDRVLMSVYIGRTRLCGIFGADKVTHEGVGIMVPFLLHDGFMSKHIPVKLHRTCKRLLGDDLPGVLEIQPGSYICNYIWEGNKRNIAWLKRLGFDVSRHGPLPPHRDTSILQFHKRRT